MHKAYYIRSIMV